MKRFTAVLLAAVSMCVLTPLASAEAEPLELPQVHLVASIAPQMHAAALSAPFAQIDAPAPVDVAQMDPDLAPVIQGMAKAFTPDGKVSWIVTAPLIVLVLVLVCRKYLKGAIPWFETTAGGYALNIGFSLGLAFLNLGLKGGHLDPPTIISLLFQVGYSFGASYLIHHTQKDVREKIAAKGELAAATVSDGDQAAARLEQLGKG